MQPLLREKDGGIDPPGKLLKVKVTGEMSATKKNPLLRHGKGVIFAILKSTAAISFLLVRWAPFGSFARPWHP